MTPRTSSGPASLRRFLHASPCPNLGLIRPASWLTLQLHPAVRRPFLPHGPKVFAKTSSFKRQVGFLHALNNKRILAAAAGGLAIERLQSQASDRTVPHVELVLLIDFHRESQTCTDCAQLSGALASAVSFFITGIAFRCRSFNCLVASFISSRDLDDPSSRDETQQVFLFEVL
jgi:hypothetical protein